MNSLFENARLGCWDVLLVVVVSVQTTVIAYVHHPRWKVFVLSLPVPFSLAFLAVGRPLDATNVTGLIMLLIFTHAVRLLHLDCRLPIVPSIVLSTLAYAGLGWWLAGLLPTGPRAFWISFLAALVVAAAALRLTPRREEPGHRSPLPVWIKLPSIAAVTIGLLLLKNNLHGFTTVFPMVGVVAAYEARYSLWTVCRQIPVMMFLLLGAMVVMHVAQPRWGAVPALALGWVAILALLWATERSRRPSERGGSGSGG